LPRDCTSIVETFSLEGNVQPGDKVRCDCGATGVVSADGLEVDWDE
jgi:hypothetical protein